MTCVFQRGGPKCTKPASDQCQNWGVGEGFCDDHIARVRSRLLGHRLGFGNKIDQAQADPFGAFVEDYIKLYALMMDTSFCRSLMTKMNSEMKSGQALRAKNGAPDERDTSAKRPDDKKYIRLSRVLEYYEGLCWFPTTHRLYTGALTSENYQTVYRPGIHAQGCRCRGATWRVLPSHSVAYGNARSHGQLCSCEAQCMESHSTCFVYQVGRRGVDVQRHLGGGVR